MRTSLANEEIEVGVCTICMDVCCTSRDTKQTKNEEGKEKKVKVRESMVVETTIFLHDVVGSFEDKMFLLERSKQNLYYPIAFVEV